MTIEILFHNPLQKLNLYKLVVKLIIYHSRRIKGSTQQRFVAIARLGFFLEFSAKIQKGVLYLVTTVMNTATATSSETLAEIVFQNSKRTFFLKKTKKLILFKLCLYLCMETKWNEWINLK